MKKQLLLMLLALPLIGYLACRKTDQQIPVEQIKDSFARESALFLEKQLSSEDYASLDFTDYGLMKKNENEAIGVRFNVKGTGGKKFAVVGKTDKGLIGNWVDLSGMSSGELTDGILKTSNFTNDTRNEVSFVKNRVVKISSVANNKTIVRSVRYNAKGEQLVSTQMSAITKPDSEEDWQWLPPVTVVGYKNNYSSPTFYSLYYYFNQAASYLNAFSTQNPYVGGGGLVFFDVPAIKKVGENTVVLEDMLNCFTTISDLGANYQIVLSADIPNNSNPDDLIVGDDPGHAFITMIKSNNGLSVTKSFGFYPTQGERWMSIFDQPIMSRIVDDGLHESNASFTINVSSANFLAAQQDAVNYSMTRMYDLNDFNCTDFAIGVFNTGFFGGPGDYINVADKLTGSPVTLNWGTTPGELYKHLQGRSANDSRIQISNTTAPARSGVCP